MKRRKLKGARKEAEIKIRLTAEQKAKIEAGAAKANLDLSAWIRVTMLREAEKVEEKP